MDDTTNPAPTGPGDTCSGETDKARRDRLDQEAKMIAEARAELDAGLYVDPAEVDTWIDSLGTNHELPLPATRRR